MRKFYIWFADQLMKLWDIPQLLFRLILAYCFYHPMVQKMQNFTEVVEWFKSMDYPVPTLAALAALVTELLGVICLPFGLLTRVISALLMFMMAVAITTVHWHNGFSASNNGFEIPLYYFLMLFSLVIIGPGRISLDGLIAGKIRKQRALEREQKKIQAAVAAQREERAHSASRHSEPEHHDEAGEE